MKNILWIFTFTMIFSQNEAQIKQAKDFIKNNGLTESEAIKLAKSKGYSDKQINDAIVKGATAHIDRFAADDDNAYLTPQILTGVNHDMTVMREESFGPVVGIMPVKDDEEAIRLMNDSDYGLTASLWTKNKDRAEKIGERLETGTVFMNRAEYLDPALCWTGCKNTGRGGSLSLIGYHNLTRPKSFHLKKA